MQDFLAKNVQLYPPCHISCITAIRQCSWTHYVKYSDFCSFSCFRTNLPIIEAAIQEILRKSWGRIFSHVRPCYERAVSDQAQSCERTWGHQNLGIFSWKSFTENWSCERALKDKVLRENLVPSPKYSRSPSVLQSTLCMCTYTSVEFFETKCFHRYLIYSSSFTSHLSLFTSHLFLWVNFFTSFTTKNSP